MTRLVAALDDSACAGTVLGVALGLARLFEASPEIVHVHEDGGAIARAISQRAGVDFREVRGSVTDALVAAAADEDVAALVLGARGTPGGKRPAGSVALSVITRSPKPVVLVPPDAPPRAACRRMLVPLDGALVTAEALAETVQIACRRGVDVVVLHILEEHALPYFSDQPQHESRDWSAEFAARQYGRGLPVRLVSRVGLPHEHVVRVAEAEDADLIALGWAQDLTPGRAKVVRETIERSRLPVLLVPYTSSATGEKG